jgi:hypothetical protein
VTPAAKLIFARLAFFDGQHQGAYPSKLGLARETGLSARHVYAGLNQLERFGLIQKVGFSRWKTVVYKIVRDNDWSLDPAATVAVDAPDNLKPMQSVHRSDNEPMQSVHNLENEPMQSVQFANDETPNPLHFLQTKRISGDESSSGGAVGRAEARLSRSWLLPDEAEIGRWKADAPNLNARKLAST